MSGPLEDNAARRAGGAHNSRVRRASRPSRPRPLAVPLADGPVHYLDFGGSGPDIVLVHGLGGSHANWLAVAQDLTEHGHVVALDLAGHGRTRSSGRGASIGANRRLLGRFLDEVAHGRAVLVGNSMGGYLALAEAAAEPAKVSSLVLVGPAVPIARGGGFDARVTAMFAAMSIPFLGELALHLRSRSPERAVQDLLALCCVDPSLIPDHVREAHVALARERASYGSVAARDFLAAQRSLVARLLQPRRFFRMVASIRCPALIVQGERDRLVRLASARALAAARPDWQLEVFPGVGHVPQLEAAARFVETVGAWLQRQPNA